MLHSTTPRPIAAARGVLALAPPSHTGQPALLLLPGRYQIGADASSSLCLDAPGIAPRHLLVLVTTEKIVVRAWDPRTWLNDGLLQEATLRRGDRLAIGPLTLRLRDATPDELMSQVPQTPPEMVDEATALGEPVTDSVDINAAPLIDALDVPCLMVDPREEHRARERAIEARAYSLATRERELSTRLEALETATAELEATGEELQAQTVILAEKSAENDARERAIEARAFALATRERALSSTEATASELSSVADSARTAELEARERAIEARAYSLAARERELTAELESLDAQIRAKNDELRTLAQSFTERDAEHEARERAIEARALALATRERELSAKLDSLDAQIAAKNDELLALAQSFADREAEHESRERAIEARAFSIATREREVASQLAEIMTQQTQEASLQTRLAAFEERETQLELQARSLTERAQALDAAEGLMREQQAAIETESRSLAERDSALQQLQTSLTAERTRLESLAAETREIVAAEAEQHTHAWEAWEQARTRMTRDLTERAEQLQVETAQLALEREQFQASRAAFEANQAQWTEHRDLQQTEHAQWQTEVARLAEEQAARERLWTQREAELSRREAELDQRLSQLDHAAQHRAAAEHELVITRQQLQRERQLFAEQQSAWLAERELMTSELAERRRQLLRDESALARERQSLAIERWELAAAVRPVLATTTVTSPEPTEPVTIASAETTSVEPLNSTELAEQPTEVCAQPSLDLCVDVSPELTDSAVARFHAVLEPTVVAPENAAGATAEITVEHHPAVEADSSSESSVVSIDESSGPHTNARLSEAAESEWEALVDDQSPTVIHAVPGETVRQPGDECYVASLLPTLPEIAATAEVGPVSSLANDPEDPATAAAPSDWPPASMLASVEELEQAAFAESTQPFLAPDGLATRGLDEDWETPAFPLESFITATEHASTQPGEELPESPTQSSTTKVSSPRECEAEQDADNAWSLTGTADEPASSLNAHDATALETVAESIPLEKSLDRPERLHDRVDESSADSLESQYDLSYKPAYPEYSAWNFATPPAIADSNEAPDVAPWLTQVASLQGGLVDTPDLESPSPEVLSTEDPDTGSMLTATPENSASESDEDPGSLRSELAKMFGLPADFAHSTHRSPSDEPLNADATAVETFPDDQEDSGAKAETALEAETSTTAESEQDADDAWRTQLAAVLQSQAVAPVVPVEPIQPRRDVAVPSPKSVEEEDSIAAYMERMLSRNGMKPNESPSLGPASSAPANVIVPEPASALEEAATEESAPVEEFQPAALALPIPAPRRTQDKDEVRAKLDAFREVANQSARTALAQHSWKSLRGDVAVQGALCGTATLAAAGYFSAPLWGSPIQFLPAFGCVVAAGWVGWQLTSTLQRLKQWNPSERLLCTTEESETAEGHVETMAESVEVTSPESAELPPRSPVE